MLYCKMRLFLTQTQYFHCWTWTRRCFIMEDPVVRLKRLKMAAHRAVQLLIYSIYPAVAVCCNWHQCWTRKSIFFPYIPISTLSSVVYCIEMWDSIPIYSSCSTLTYMSQKSSHFSDYCFLYLTPLEKIKISFLKIYDFEWWREFYDKMSRVK